MNFDHWKCTDERDAEPQLEQHKCEECGGKGDVFAPFVSRDFYRVRKPCECCNGSGFLMVMP